MTHSARHARAGPCDVHGDDDDDDVWKRRAQSRPAPSADVAGVSPVPAQMWAGVSPVPAQTWPTYLQLRVEVLGRVDLDRRAREHAVAAHRPPQRVGPRGISVGAPHAESLEESVRLLGMRGVQIGHR
jgi:hypothetical protein